MCVAAPCKSHLLALLCSALRSAMAQSLALLLPFTHSLYTLSFVGLFYSWSLNTTCLLKSHRLTSPAQASLLRSDSDPKMTRKSAAISSSYLKLNFDLYSAKISSSSGLSHLNKCHLCYSNAKGRELKIYFS